jgi:hypothetical protein
MFVNAHQQVPLLTPNLHLSQAMEAEYFCGFCFCDAGIKAGSEGKWQLYGDVYGDDKPRWTYLCQGCFRQLWRDFSKLEDFLNEKQRDMLFVQFLQKELPKANRPFLNNCSK